MADYGWRNDERRRWDENRERLRSRPYGFGRSNWPDDGRDRGSRDEWQAMQQDFGRESDYGAGYATPRRGGDYNLNNRPGGMRDDSDWRARDRYNAVYSSDNPTDFQDYGNWQNDGNLGYPRFGDNFERDRDVYGRGYGDYGYPGRGYAPYGRDYGDSRETNRNLWNRATDEVASWVGDDDAQRRREQDHLRSHAGRGPRGYTRSDDRIREDVNDRLTDDWRLDASNIEVSVSSGEVTLTGTVSNRGDKRRAEDLVENISGVKHVQNNLRVNDSWQSSSAETSTSTPVGSSGTNTSLSGSQNRPGTYSSTSGTSGTGTSPSTNGNVSH